jgi:hypothetical protein
MVDVQGISVGEARELRKEVNVGEHQPGQERQRLLRLWTSKNISTITLHLSPGAPALIRTVFDGLPPFHHVATLTLIGGGSERESEEAECAALSACLQADAAKAKSLVVVKEDPVVKEHRSTVTSLRLFGVKVSAVELVMKALSEDERVRTLHVACCALGGAKREGKGEREREREKDEARVGEGGGVESVCDMLRKNGHLTSLSLDQVSCTPDDAVSLFDSLLHNTTLASFSLPLSRSPDAAAMASLSSSLSALLALSPSLSSLSLSGVSFAEQDLMLLAEGIEKNDTIVKLELGQERAGDGGGDGEGEGARRIRERLALNRAAAAREREREREREKDVSVR